jgi:hypothetical protein
MLFKRYLIVATINVTEIFVAQTCFTGSIEWAISFYSQYFRHDFSYDADTGMATYTLRSPHLTFIQEMRPAGADGSAGSGVKALYQDSKEQKKQAYASDDAGEMLVVTDTESIETLTGSSFGHHCYNISLAKQYPLSFALFTASGERVHLDATPQASTNSYNATVPSEGDRNGDTSWAGTSIVVRLREYDWIFFAGSSQPTPWRTRGNRLYFQEGALADGTVLGSGHVLKVDELPSAV